jgi:hypothetical protein
VANMHVVHIGRAVRDLAKGRGSEGVHVVVVERDLESARVGVGRARSMEWTVRLLSVVVVSIDNGLRGTSLER